MEYGYNAIGRVNAWVGNEEVLMFVKTHPSIERVLIFADNDSNGVGFEGASELSKFLSKEGLYNEAVVVPKKDLRNCRQAGITIKEILNG